MVEWRARREERCHVIGLFFFLFRQQSAEWKCATNGEMTCSRMNCGSLPWRDVIVWLRIRVERYERLV